MGYPIIFNPVDLLLSVCVPLFPLDYLIFTLLVLYISLATISGISRAGIRLLWIELYAFKRQRTAPQGVLLATLLLMLFVIALVFVLDTVAPRYLMFGGQTYLSANLTSLPCSVLAPPAANCSVTQIERIVTDVKFRFSFFSVVFYWSNWVFLGLFVVGCIFSVCLRVRSHQSSAEQEDSE
jgi:LMBR1 domain-containing protein 1